MDTTPPNSIEEWIAIQPLPGPAHTSQTHQISADISPSPERTNPPSFHESQFDIILRRQRPRPGLKFTNVPSRFLNLSNEFEFAGWGSLTSCKLTSEDHERGAETLRSVTEQKILGQFMASGLAGNDILGGVFYTLPAVVAVASVYSPISLFVAALSLFFWRPIMEELVSALPIGGAPYSYLLNVSTKTVSAVGASLLLLDFTSTSVVASATVASYLEGEVKLPFPGFVVAIFVFVIMAIMGLSGVKESARIALVVLTLHMVTMFALAVASAIAWGRAGNAQLHENWVTGQATSGREIAHQIFNGTCIGMLLLTGFECVPAYVAHIKPGRFPLVLRNLHIPAIILNAGMMTLVLAVVPLDNVMKEANVLSVLADTAGGRWLRVWVVADAIVVLCGVGLAGLFSACELLEQLARDRVIPKIFLKRMPYTASAHISVLAFIGFCGVLYASSGASLSILSKMFTLVWLCVMALFPLSLLLLKFNRGRLPRARRTSIWIIFIAFGIALTIICGNIAIDPTTAGYFAAYFFAVVIFFTATQNKTSLLGWVYWVYDQNPVLHTCRLTRRWGERMIKMTMRLRRQPVCILVKTDEINLLFQMILYVRQNEETSCLKIVHFHDDKQKDGPPSELEANAKILDEAFPEITIDLIFAEGAFVPANVAALAHRLQIPRSLMFMSCPGDHFPYSVDEFGTRIIAL